MNFRECYQSGRIIMTEGALGIRLRNEYGITYDSEVANANLIYKEEARAAITFITNQYLEIARKYQLPMMFVTPTRRANRSNVEQSIYDGSIIEDNVRFYRAMIKDAIPENEGTEIFLGGMMGCKGDAYKANEVLTVEEAYDFHSWQTQLFANAKIDYLYAAIMPALPEAIGMAKAMAQTAIPYIISLMIRENGRMIDGTTIHDAIAAIEEAVEEKPLFYMTNCVHPVNVSKALAQEFNQTDLVRTRFIGIQANASPMTPEELDGSSRIITSEPEELAEKIMKLRETNGFQILGGCCGTDQRHIEELAKRIAKLR
jgi:S-methylmethionine-dependent homocysteine/selenocysteine methylase